MLLYSIASIKFTAEGRGLVSMSMGFALPSRWHYWTIQCVPEDTGAMDANSNDQLG